jgi:BCD family chlorophyll transporter-like MFS transporter
MPFALLILSGDTHGPAFVGVVGAALAFLLVGAGMHVTQTAGLALATDLAPDRVRPRVVALLYVMLLLGTVASALAFSALLENFSQLRLIQVIQGAALLTMILNGISLWKQEPRQPELTRHDRPRARFAEAWQALHEDGFSRRLLLAVGLGSLAFSMQDVLLEPYGAEVLGLAVSETTLLTAFLAGGTLVAFTLAAVLLQRGANEYRLSSAGLLVGVLAFVFVVFAGPLQSAALFSLGAGLIGFGGGLFAVGTLMAAMALARDDQRGLALGAWGSVQALAIGLGIALGGGLRDGVSAMAVHGALGPVLAQPVTGYSFVYHLEIALLFATLVAIGPLVRVPLRKSAPSRFGLAELPG